MDKIKIQLPSHADILILEWAIETNNTAVIESYRPMAEACNAYLTKVVEIFKESGILDLYEAYKKRGES